MTDFLRRSINDLRRRLLSDAERAVGTIDPGFNRDTAPVEYVSGPVFGRIDVSIVAVDESIKAVDGSIKAVDASIVAINAFINRVDATPLSIGTRH